MAIIAAYVMSSVRNGLPGNRVIALNQWMMTLESY
jgi:hypothetical protein